jgi:hypothetical protein
MHLFHFSPLLATNALEFAIKKATPEGKATMSALLILSLFSWTIIITKAQVGQKILRSLRSHARSAGDQAQG